jgi:hypothetical protein
MVAAAALLLATSLIAACGDDDDDTDATGNTSGGGTPTSELSGDPVEVVINVGLSGAIPFPQVETAMLAAQDAINAEGGIKGRPLKVNFCDGKSPTDPGPSIECNREAAANDAIVASVGDYSSFGDQIIPIQHEAGMATIAPVPLSGASFSVDSSFPLMTSEGGALGVLLADMGVTDVGLAYIDIPAGAQSVGFGNIFLGMKYGKEYSQTAPIPLSATDVTPQVASFDKSDGIALSIAPTQFAQFLKAYTQGGFDQKLGAPALSMLPRDVEPLGDAVDGVYVVSGWPIVTGDHPGIERFKKEMQAKDPEASLDETAINAWVGLHAFAQVANTIEGEVTRASVLEAWKNLTTLDVFGMLPPDLNLQESPLGVPGLERLTNVWAQYGQFEGTEIVDSGRGWVSLIAQD